MMGSLREKEEEQEGADEDQRKYEPSSPAVPGAVITAIMVSLRDTQVVLRRQLTIFHSSHT